MTKEEKTIERLKREICKLGSMLPGSISEQYNVCGKAGCKCKRGKNPVRHGPYFQLSFTLGGKSSSFFIKKEGLPEARRRIRRFRLFKQLGMKHPSLAAMVDAYQMEVNMGTDKKTRICCRLICFRVKEEVANQRRMRLKREAKKKGRIPGAQSLLLADWTIIVTNVPEKWIPSEMLWRIYSIRWQIELLFKQMKSIVQIHRSNTENIQRLKCEIYGKLIMAILINRIHGAINSELWNTQKRELSMEKFYKRIQERAFQLLELLLTSFWKAVTYLSKEVDRLMKNCMKYQQPSRKSTLELLEEEIDLKVEDLSACLA